MNLTDDIVEYGVALKVKIMQLEKQLEQKDQVIAQLQKQLNESKSKKD